MNRGSHGDPPGRAGAPRRFNEAPIHESGKWEALGSERG